MTRTREQRLTIYEQHPRLAAYTVRQFFGSADDDLIAVAETAIWQATETWDSDRGTFSTHAVSRAKGACLHWLTRRATLIHIPAWYQLAHPDFGFQFGQIDLCHDIAAEEVGVDIPVGELSVSLSSAARDGLRWLIAQTLGGYSQQEIAEREGTRQVAVSRCIAKAKQELRDSPVVQEWAAGVGI